MSGFFRDSGHRWSCTCLDCEMEDREHLWLDKDYQEALVKEQAINAVLKAERAEEARKYAPRPLSEIEDDMTWNPLWDHLPVRGAAPHHYDAAGCAQPKTPEKADYDALLKAEQAEAAAQLTNGGKKSHLPVHAQARKEIPLASGLIDYFPDALVQVAAVSYVGNQQHNPGQPLTWDRTKSSDEADTLIRHFLDRGTYDTDGVRHSAKVAWRALALLQKEIEADRI